MVAMISVQITCGGNVLLPWTILSNYSDSCTFGELYKGLRDGSMGPDDWTFPPKFVNHDVSASIGKKKADHFDNILMSAGVNEASKLFGHYVRIALHETSTYRPSSSQQNEKGKHETGSEVERKTGSGETGEKKRNAFEVLVNASRKLSLPSMYNADTKIKNGKHLQYNKFILTLQKAQLGFTHASMLQGTSFVNAVTNALWYVDPHWETLTERGFHIPMLFEHISGYNVPETHKHKTQRMDQSTLGAHARDLDRCLEMPWINGPLWRPIKNAVVQLSEVLHGYKNYLAKSLEKAQERHGSTIPIRDDTQSIEMISPKFIVKPTISSRYKPLTEHLSKTEEFTPICVDEYTPGDTRQRRHFIDNLKNGLPYKCILFRVSTGNNLGTHNFIWRIPMNTIQKEDILNRNNDVVQGITKDLPTYHTRSMKRNFLQKVTLMCDVRPMEARYIYKDLTGDHSAPETCSEKVIDEKVKQAFELQDPDVILDLREHNEGQPVKYSVFFDHAKTYIENVVETAVDDRRHDKIQHLATAMSVRDLLNQVKDTCPEGTPIPSEQWLRLQFAPKNHSSMNSLQYTGNLQVKYQVQSRQLRKSHVDLHYASAIFRYMKDFAVKFRENAVLVCMDDKHHCKVGEPGHPVAAVDRGKRVIVGQDSVFAVSDHDFTKFSIVPSVTMLVDIPETIDGSFYRGQVNVGVKDLVLEPSSPLRHITELSQILNNDDTAKYKKPIMCIYSDGGPDHRLTYLSVQLSILCLFLKGNYDYIVAARTPPMSSWKNPPERIMSLLNLALQAVGLMRAETSAECERKLKSANSLKQLRELADKYPDIHQEMVDSMEPVKILLTQLFRRLELKDVPFKCFTAASDGGMKELWVALDRFGDPLDFGEMHQKELKQAVKDRPELSAFLEHCCTCRSYFFSVKKCGVAECDICPPPVLPPDQFAELHPFPDPVPGEEGHYKDFSELYGIEETTEEFCPSHQQKNTLKAHHGHDIPFSPSAQTAKTCHQTVACIECNRPRVVYSASKLNNSEKSLLTRLLAMYHYSCGSVLQELKPEDVSKAPRINALLDKVFVRSNITCDTAIEVPYFSSKCFPPICYHCGSDSDLVVKESQYPECKTCESSENKPKALKRKRNVWEERKEAKKNKQK